MGFDELNDLLNQETEGLSSDTTSPDKPTIAVIDDDRDVREALELILSDTYTVITCASGDEGIARVNKDIHAILLDIKMRGKDGFETFEHIKAIWPDIPIIFHSGYQDVKDPYDIMNQYRPFGYILKGGNSSELLDTLASATELYRQKLINEKLIEDLKKANTSLDNANQKLGAALTNAKMSARVKSEFISSISHELRTPLNAIINYPEYLLDEFQEKEYLVCPACNAEFNGPISLDSSSLCPNCKAGNALQRKKLQTFRGQAEETTGLLKSIAKEGKKLARTIDDLLDIGTLETGKISIENEEFSVAKTVEDVVQTVSPLASKRSITVVSPSLPDGFSMVADRVKLGQILVHLVGNAIKFSDNGSKVEIRMEESDDNVTFAVRDWGIGIKKEHQEFVFDSFRQVDSTSTRQHGGTGLGLAITKRLVELQGGKIWLESAFEKGSCFSFSLPRRVASHDAAVPGKPLPKGHRGTSETIFVLDDDVRILESASDILAAGGYSIEVSDNPLEAIDTISRLKPSLLILDIMMPKISGLTILRALQEQNYLDDMRVLVSSGFYSNREIAIEMGAYWIAKPWTSEELLGTVEQILVTNGASGT